MKIAILTLPLVNNYGGILQAYAISKFINKQNMEVAVLDLDIESGYLSFAFAKFLIAKTFIKKYKNAKFTPVFQNKTAKNFVNSHIKTTQKIKSSKDLEKMFKNNNFDAIIVGSDQVFRPGYFGKFKDDFSLGFVGDDVIKLSYAASFGGDKYKGDNIEFHSKNLAKFKAISVREKSGIKICKETFGVEAKHVLDPTMMLEVNEYKELFKDIKKSDTKDKIFAYVLDKSREKEEAIFKFANLHNLDVFEVNDGNSSSTTSIQEWLKNIHDAKIVITDSFHGSVFSILFNKPFFTFINEARGADRFESLFEMFGLEDRVIKDFKFTNNSINYEKVNKILDEKKEYSKEFLISNLKINK